MCQGPLTSNSITRAVATSNRDDVLVDVERLALHEADVAVTADDAAASDEAAGVGWPDEARLQVEGRNEPLLTPRPCTS